MKNRRFFKRGRIAGGGLVALTACLTVGCGGDKNSETAGGFPGAAATDREKVEYVAKTYGPDSLARFICYGALGKSAEGKIDSLAMAQLYALELYAADEEKIARFSRTFDETVEALPLADSYRITKMTGMLDDTQMPLDLGLHYGAKVRREQLSAAKVKSDTTELSKMVDEQFFRLFRKAFETAMKN